MRAPQDEDDHRVSTQLTMSNSPSRSRGACLRPEFCILASLTPNRGVGGAPIRHSYILRSPYVAPGYLRGLAFFSCAPLTPPLPSSGYTAWNRDKTWGRSCASGTSFPPPSSEAF